MKSSAKNVPTAKTENGHIQWVSKLRYTKSFLAKLYLSDKDKKETYCAILNKFSAYKGVSERTAFSGVTFSVKRKPIARVTLSGKTFTVYFAADPSSHGEGRYKLIPSGDAKKNAALPSKFRVRSNGGLKFALAVADEIIADLALVKKSGEVRLSTYKDFPTDSFSNLLTKGLIRPVKIKTKNEADVEDVDAAAHKTPDISVSSENVNETDETADGKNDNDVYSDTLKTNALLIERHGEYGELANSFLDNGEIKCVKKRLIRSVDERWVNAIEDCLAALDEVMRNPSRFIEETEELLPVERTKKITTQSIKHLSQHTGLISRVENGVVIPSKLLNVFRDESMMTYENKFVNTLLMRLDNFVTERYETAVDKGADAVKYSFQFSDGLELGEERGNLSLSIELTSPNDKAEKDKFFSSDLWERVKKISRIITDYRKSDFVARMGNASIFPPLVRTNPILKNKNLHQCLELWEFLDGYDEQDGITASEEEIPVSEVQKVFAKEGLMEQFTVFRKFVETVKANEKAADADTVSETPAESAAIDNRGEKVAANKQVGENTTETEDNEIALYVEIALEAESLALNELKEQEEEILAEREELLKEETAAPEKEIRSAVDGLPVEYAEYSFEQKDVGNGVENIEEEKPETKVAEPEKSGETAGDRVIYVKSFAVKLAEADERLKNYFCDIANAFLLRKGVREREAFDHMDFVAGRKTLARVIIIGKSIRVFFALDPITVDKKYRITDKSDVKKYAATPSMLKVRGPLGLKHALELADFICGGLKVLDGYTLKNADEYKEKPLNESISSGKIRVKVISHGEKTVNQFFKSRTYDKPTTKSGVNASTKYDYSEEVAEYIKRSDKIGGKKVVLDLASPTEIAKAIKRVDDAETEAAKAKMKKRNEERTAKSDKKIVKDADGDPLLLKEEAVQSSSTAADGRGNGKQVKDEKQKSDNPIEVPPDGDVLAPKPVTMEEMAASINAARRKSDAVQTKTQKEKKDRGFFARLFGRKNKK